MAASQRKAGTRAQKNISHKVSKRLSKVINVLETAQNVKTILDTCMSAKGAKKYVYHEVMSRLGNKSIDPRFPIVLEDVLKGIVCSKKGARTPAELDRILERKGIEREVILALGNGYETILSELIRRGLR